MASSLPFGRLNPFVEQTFLHLPACESICHIHRYCRPSDFWRPFLFTLLGQLLGIGVLSPLYYYLYYVYTPIEKFKASDMRLGCMNYALTVLPTMVLAYYIPAFAMLNWPSLSGREAWLFFWQMFPIWIAITTLVLSSFILDTTNSDKLHAPSRDMQVIKYTIGSLVMVSSAVWLWTFITSSSTLNFIDLFLPQIFPTKTTNLVDFTREFLKFDEVSLFGCTFLWLAYLFWDLKVAGMAKISWLMLTIRALCSILLIGPGGTAGLAWLWRENILASTRHKDAITEASLEKVEKRAVVKSG
jgi:hypothetical protein